MNWTTIANLVSPALIGIIGWLTKNAFGRVTDSVAAVQREVDAFKAQMNGDIRKANDRIDAADGKIDSKVSDEEWIRESMRLRNDVQRMGETLARIEGKTDSTLQLAVAVNRVASAIEGDKESERAGQ